MHSSLKSAVVGALESYELPAFDIAAITRRAERVPKSVGRDHRRWLVGVLLVALPCIAAAAVLFKPLQVTHNYGMWQLNGGKSVARMHPTQATLDEFARAAAYRVTWPSQVPNGARLWFAGGMASEVFTIMYRCPGSSERTLVDDPLLNSITFIIVPRNSNEINPRLRNWVGNQDATFWARRNGQHVRAQNAEWDAGDEHVRVTAACLSAQQVNLIRRAMIRMKRA